MKNKIVSLITVVALFSSVGCGVRTPGESDKVGIITSIHKVGVLNKTWEAQIIRGGMNGGSGSFGAPFNFTIETEALADTCNKYMTAGTEVKIHYRTEMIYSALRTDSGGDFLVTIAPVKPISAELAKDISTMSKPYAPTP